MTKIYQFSLPITPSSLRGLQEILRSAQILTLFDESIDPYDAGLYRYQAAEYGSECKAVVDLNVFKDVLSIARPGDARAISDRQIGAAFIAFCQCADIMIEPAMAIHESPNQLKEELTWFRRIDNADTNALISIAFGGGHQIAIDQLPEIGPLDLPGTIPEKLVGHMALQTAVLKIVSLVRAGGRPVDNFERFLRWSYDEYLFSREAIHLALLQFSRGQAKPILRNINSHNPTKRLSGVENAVWDLIHARDWSKRIGDQGKNNDIWLFCSRDRALQRLARNMVMATDNDSKSMEHMEKIFSRSFDESAGKRLLRLYLDLYANADADIRPANRPDFDEHCLSVHEALMRSFLK